MYQIHLLQIRKSVSTFSALITIEQFDLAGFRLMGLEPKCPNNCKSNASFNEPRTAITWHNSLQRPCRGVGLVNTGFIFPLKRCNKPAADQYPEF